MRQQHAADHVARRVNAGNGCGVAVIHLDESLFRQLQAGSGGNDRLHADGHQADVRRDFLFLSLAVFHAGLDLAVAGFRDGFHGGSRHDLDALLLERAFQRLAGIVVFIGKHARERFNERYLGAEGVVNVGEFRANGAGTDDDHAFRPLFQHHGFLGTDDGGAVEGQAGHRAGRC